MITLVTGLWDIGRGDLSEGWSRSFDYYLKKFEQLLQVDCNMIIFGDKELESFVSERRNDSNTQFVLRDLDWFRRGEFYGQIQQVRNNPKWYNLAGWLKDSTQARLEMYNPLVMSKMFILHDALLLDKFDSEKLYWIDAGLANTVNMGYFTHDNVLPKIDKLFDNFTFICFPYQADREIHGFDIDRMTQLTNVRPDKVARGGFFGGTKELIRQMNTLYYNLIKSTLNQGLMGTEESLFTVLLYNNPTITEYVEINSDGLVYKFFEDVKNDTVQVKSLKKNYKVRKNRTGDIGLYVITFNSPKQFETLIISMLEYDSDFINKTKKFLLNNSTDLSTTPEYVRLCEQYGFEHIKKDNIGICGGRQFVAEHFANTDLKYMWWSEDDMFFQNKPNETCKNGFNRYTPNLFKKCVDIMDREDFDFLKINYTEFYGDNGTCWPWYNLPQEKRVKFFPEKPNLPVGGLDPEAPKTKFNNIKTYLGLPYVDGEIYYCNWTHIISQEGNEKMFLDTKWTNPFENTWMSHHYQMTKKDELKGGLLLLTPVEHERFHHYERHLRREN
jgi:hypothetical protein